MSSASGSKISHRLLCVPEALSRQHLRSVRRRQLSIHVFTEAVLLTVGIHYQTTCRIQQLILNKTRRENTSIHWTLRSISGILQYSDLQTETD